jgi:transcriptional repressor NrdR
MVCLYCSGDTAVANSRPQHRTNQVWRRRRCLSCGAVFTTEESARRELAWTVGGRRGRSEPFSRDKLFLSLYRSCEHRKTVLEDAKGLTETVISRLAGSLSGGALSRQDIIGAAQVALNRFDKSASVHYAAYHKGA